MSKVPPFSSFCVYDLKTSKKTEQNTKAKTISHKSTLTLLLLLLLLFFSIK